MNVSMHALECKLEDETFESELFNQLIKNDCGYFVESKNHVLEKKF